MKGISKERSLQTGWAKLKGAYFSGFLPPTAAVKRHCAGLLLLQPRIPIPSVERAHIPVVALDDVDLLVFVDRLETCVPEGAADFVS